MLGDIEAYIARANGCLSAGDMAGLEALNPLAEAITRGIATLDAAQGAEYAPEIDALRGQLTTLMEAMDAAKTELAKTLQSSGTHQRAARAYLKPPE